MSGWCLKCGDTICICKEVQEWMEGKDKEPNLRQLIEGCREETHKAICEAYNDDRSWELIAQAAISAIIGKLEKEGVL